MVLVAEDVGQDRKAVAFLDEAHGNPGHMRLHRNACVHQGEAAAAHRGHRGRAVRFGNFGDHAHRIAEFLSGRQGRQQRALGEAPVPDLAALGRAHAPGLAGGVRGHVVVEQEAVAVLAHQRVDDLLVAARAQRGNDQRLRLAAREQGRAVSPRQDAGADRDRAHRAGIAAVDARLAVEDLAAHDLRLQRKADVFHRIRIRPLIGAYSQLVENVLPDRVDCGGAHLFLLHREGVAQVLLGELLDTRDHRFVLGGGLPVPGRLAGNFGQRMDGLDGRLHLLVPECHGAQHDVFGQFHRFGFDHQHALLGPGDHQVELRILQLAGGGVENVLAVEVPDTSRTDRAVERDARERQRRRHGEHRNDVGIDFRIARHYRRDDLDFVVKAIREQRADRAIDQAAGQRFFF